MMFATDHDCIAFLKNKGFFDRGIEPTPGDVILNHEILLSQEVLSNGWNISSILPAYRALDYRNIADDINPSSYQGDPWFPGAYFRRSIHPLETIFFKTNRGIMGATELEYLGDLFHPPKISDPSTKFNPLEATLAGIASAWKGHKNFAIWLTSRLKANTIVDLGVDFGYSTFCFAAACAGEVYAIDSFEGDEQTGFRNTFQEVSRTRERLGLWNVNIVHGYFDAVAGSWNRSIDILHIDGKHTYEAAKEDYLTWSKFVKPSGAVLLHDTCVPHFGVRQLLHEIALPKVNFSHSHGLGVVSQDRSLVLEIARTFESLIEPRSLQPRILDFLRAWRARKSPKPLDLR
jgi:hypothetical protein